MEIEITYGVGFGRHKDTLEVDDDATVDEVESMVQEIVLERLDWSWKRLEN